MAEAAVRIKERERAPDRARQAQARVAMPDVFVKTTKGVIIFEGRDGNELREKIEKDEKHSVLDYSFFDDDRKRWAYWAVQDAGGNIRPLTFPELSNYSLTSPQLYTKAVTYPRILAHAVGLLKEKPTTMWDRMMKPTTIILAIVAIVFIMMFAMVALQG